MIFTEIDLTGEYNTRRVTLACSTGITDEELKVAVGAMKEWR